MDALRLLKQGGPGPFTCTQVAQKAAECGNGMTAASLNVYLSNMSIAEREKLVPLGLPPKQGRSAEIKVARTLGSDDARQVEARYLAAIDALPQDKRTIRAVADVLGIPPGHVWSYLFGNSTVASLVIDFRGPASP